jgi:NurA-like 5'-3' nuclease
MSRNALRLMSKIGLVNHVKKKVCLGVLHIELAIMYKLFLLLRVYNFIIKFFVTRRCEVVTVCVLTLVM